MALWNVSKPCWTTPRSRTAFGRVCGPPGTPAEGCERTASCTCWAERPEERNRPLDWQWHTRWRNCGHAEAQVVKAGARLIFRNVWMARHATRHSASVSEIMEVLPVASLASGWAPSYLCIRSRSAVRRFTHLESAEPPSGKSRTT